MLSVETKDRLRKASGIWLLFMGVALIVLGILGIFELTANLGGAGFSIIMIFPTMIIPGIFVIFAGYLVLNETFWGIAFTLSIIACVTLVVLSANGIYPVICYVLLGLSIISTVSLFVVKSEF